jgi:indole-3-glycerol phosphate synthase
MHIMKVIQVSEAAEAQHDRMMQRHKDRIARYKDKSRKRKEFIAEFKRRCPGWEITENIGMADPDTDLKIETWGGNCEDWNEDETAFSFSR